MRNLLAEAWAWFQNLIKSSPAGSSQTPTPFRDKAFAVAGVITKSMVQEISTVPCPICLEVVHTRLDLDLQKSLALHLSGWHHEYITEQWDIMQKKTQPVIRLPFIIAGLGVAAAFGALISISARNHAQRLPNKSRG